MSMSRFEDMFKLEEAPDVAAPHGDAAPDVLHRGFFFEKIKFAWEPGDQAIVDRIQAAADREFADLFSATFDEVKKFYETLYIPRYRNNSPVVDAHGRQLWETDESGRPIEKWEQLTGQDIEQTLMGLQRLKMIIAPRVNQLKNDAIFAKMIAGDIKDDTRVAHKSGLADDKTAKANQESRINRYQAFYRYVIWSTADTFYKEMVDFMFRLKDMRYWRTQSQE